MNKLLDELARHVALNRFKADLLPNKGGIQKFIEELHAILFAYSIEYKTEPKASQNCDEKICTISDELLNNSIQLKNILRPFTSGQAHTIELVGQFYEQLFSVYDTLLLDIKSIYAIDPAANNEAEIIITYPGFKAISYYRYANVLYKLGLKTIARVITEYGHELTGIDIHPGATIGHSFAIDHGTGVVIGETAEIGTNVVIYQGVTLGALSVNKVDQNQKRHPTIGDRVTIYANATILGGETVIGEDATIGGNTWITSSVPPRTRVVYQRSYSDFQK